MATVEVKGGVKTYLVELSQDEAEVVVGLVGAVNGDSKFEDVAREIWEALEGEVQGPDRYHPIVDGVTYDVLSIEVDEVGSEV